MTDNLRWGILGTGRIAHIFTSDLIANGFAVTAVGSRRQTSANAFAAEFGIRCAYGDYAGLASDPNVDVVYVSTPNPYHAANALLALRGGKHVLVEKPFTINSEEARSVVMLAKEKGLVALEAMWTRFLPHMLRIRDVLAAGAIGEPHSLLADHSQRLPADPANRINNLALGGGALLDLGIYLISFAFDLFDAPSEIQASARMTTTGVDGQTAIILRHEDGQLSVLQTALDTSGPNRATIIGTKGRIEIDPVWYMPTGFTVYDANNSVVERFEPTGVGSGKQYEAWELEHLAKAGRTSGEVLPPEETVCIMKTLDDVRMRIGLKYPSEQDPA